MTARRWAGRLVLWVHDYLVVSAWQVRALLAPEAPDRYAAAPPGTTPVVLLPGIYEPWQVMRTLARDLHAQGYAVHAVPTLGYNHGPVEEMAVRVGRLVVERDLRGAVLVAHSKGGLIGKQLMLEAGMTGRIAGMVTVATPFAGSRYATWFPLSSVRSLSPRAAGLLALAAERAVNAAITSVYAEFDPHVPGGSALVGGRNLEVPTTGHFRVLADPRVRRWVCEEVRRHASAAD